MSTMTDEHDLVRQQYFDCDGPVDIDLEWGPGTIEVLLAGEEAGAGPPGAPHPGAGDTSAGQPPAIVVEVRPQRRPAVGLFGLLSWMGGQFGGPAGDLAAEAVRQTSIAVHGNRLSVRSPRNMPLRTVPLGLVVHAPAGSSLHAQAGSAQVRVGGPADRVHVASGSGDITVDQAAGPVQVKTGSGTVHLGPVLDGVSARTGSGDVAVSSLHGDGSLHSGTGDIWLGTVVGGDVTAKTGSGDLTVADAAAGQLQLVTGSGDLRVGIRGGVLAEVDVVSGSGRTRSDLPVSDRPPADGAPVLSVRARTGSGEAVISPATV
jgi:hypothetical protein